MFSSNFKLRIYEIFTKSPEDALDLVILKEKYEQARTLYLSRQFKEASVIFGELMEKDRASELLYKRCISCMEKEPDEDWDGVWIFHHK